MHRIVTEVIVVGGGPSGLTLASELAIGGLRPIVLERRTGTIESRAGTVLPRVLELFDARGVADRIIRKTREIYDFPFRDNHIYAGLRSVDWRNINSRFGFTLMIPQNATEEILTQWARENDVDISYGMTVDDVRAADDGFEVRATDSGGDKHVFSARYVIGADGARSVVRKSANLPFEGHDGTFRGMVVDAYLQCPFSEGHGGNDNEYGWTRAFAFGAGITRFNIVHEKQRHVAKDVPVTVNEVTACLRDILGTDYGITGFRWASRFDDTMRCVPALRKGNLFLVGESARIHYPASGVGMNFCIQDAFNLGWKLSAVVNGHADPSLLDTYEAERMPVMRDLLESVKTQVAMQFNFSHEGVALKRQFQKDYLPQPDLNRRLGLELNGIARSYPGPAGGHALTGFPVPDLDLVLPTGEQTRVGELLRAQHFLLLDLRGSGRFDKLDVGALPVRIVKALPVRLPLEQRGLTALLVRPDAYVAWATEERADVAGVLAQIAKWLRLPAQAAMY
jgi:2-polyprenyl-6-methoxyphenol hydroxylase-like FAD-dependent oxidoreductase